jgi:hypothetical protein
MKRGRADGEGKIFCSYRLFFYITQHIETTILSVLTPREPRALAYFQLPCRLSCKPRPNKYSSLLEPIEITHNISRRMTSPNTVAGFLGTLLALINSLDCAPFFAGWAVRSLGRL